MKNRVFLFSAVMAAMMAACGGKTAPEATGQDSTVNDSASVAAAVEDTPVMLELKKYKFQKENKYAMVEISVEVPTNNEAIATALWKSFCKQADGFDAQVATYKGGYTDGDKIVAYYGKQVLAALTSSHMEFLAEEETEDGEEVEPSTKHSEGLIISKVYEKGNFVVFTFSGYSYTGGAHGLDGYSTLTFDKKNGLEVKEVISKKNCKALQKEMRKGLCKYFECKDSELNGNLDVKGSIPWPTNPPYLTAEGVCFHYGSYEIACYGAGQPEFVIPYSKLEGMLLVDIK